MDAPNDVSPRGCESSWWEDGVVARNKLFLLVEGSGSLVCDWLMGDDIMWSSSSDCLAIERNINWKPMRGTPATAPR